MAKQPRLEDNSSVHCIIRIYIILKSSQCQSAKTGANKLHPVVFDSMIVC